MEDPDRAGRVDQLEKHPDQMRAKAEAEAEAAAAKELVLWGLSAERQLADLRS